MQSTNHPVNHYTVHAVVDSLHERLQMQQEFLAELVANVFTLPHDAEGSQGFVDEHGHLHVFLFADQLDAANKVLARVNVGTKRIAILFG